jgi:hypothetical protein
VGWVEDVSGVNAQKQSRDVLLASLRLVLRDLQQHGCSLLREGGNHS